MPLGMSFSRDNLELAKKWSERWEREKTYEARPSKTPKYFITFPFPYVNGAPHVGHAYSCFRADVFARFKRLQGYNVLFPQGFHATGEPIVGAQKRLQNDDENQIRTMKTFGATDAEIEKMKSDPQFIVAFWRERWIRDLKLGGLSIDWSRTFTTTDITPAFSRFVEWQYRTLYALGRIKQGTHPVVWDPSTLSPTGDHDRYKGEGESPQLFRVVLFDSPQGKLACATLRPETVFQVTNLWLAEAEYVRARVDDELWVLHASAVEKLADQLHEVEVLGTVRAAELAKLDAVHPLSGAKLPIFVSPFVDPEHGTGLVMSVPAHAPYDYVALRDLAKDGNARAKAALASAKNMISLGEVPKGTLNAAFYAEKHKVTDIHDEKALEKATSDVYKQEFHRGVFSQPELEGLRGDEAKERAISILEKRDASSQIWEITGEVIARSMTKCHVKILENQWFLDYKDPEWKERSKAHIETMDIYPEEARQQFLNTVDWFEEKACARRSGLGTKLPFDESWIVETLSDSTVYMAYYTISRFVNDGSIAADDLTDAVFDHLFRGAPAPKHPKAKVIEAMKAEFEHFYPVDMRSSGKDLIQNHLTFFIMQHVALFEEPFWPRGVSVNGYVSVEGEKMSKSKGNIIPFADLCREHGPDLVRANITSSADGMDDANWSAATIAGLASRLDQVEALASRVEAAKGRFDYAGTSLAERVLIDAVNRATVNVADHFEHFRLRSALQESFFDLTARLRFALKAEIGPTVLRWAIERIVAMNAPFFPFAAAELSERLGFELAWPDAKAEYEFDDAERIVAYVDRLRSDLISVRDLVARKGEVPTRAVLYPAENWLYSLAERLDEPLKELMALDEFRLRGSETAKAYAQLKKIRPRLSARLERAALDAFVVSVGEDAELEVSIGAPGDSGAKPGLPEKPGVLVE